MDKTLWARVLNSDSDNRKSKIQKPPRRRKLAGSAALVVTLALCGTLAQAQQAKNVHRIGYQSAGSSAAREEAFRQGLREPGYVEGQNIIIEWRLRKESSIRSHAMRLSWSA